MVEGNWKDADDGDGAVSITAAKTAKRRSASDEMDRSMTRHVSPAEVLYLPSGSTLSHALQS